MILKNGLCLLIVTILLGGCYTYSQQEEEDADHRFAQIGRKLSEAKAEENLLRAWRDKFLSDSDFAAASQEDEDLVRHQKSVTALQGQYNQAKNKSVATRAGDIKPDSPVVSLFKLFKRNE